MDEDCVMFCNNERLSRTERFVCNGMYYDEMFTKAATLL